MKLSIDPLQHNALIVDAQGRPTPFFMRQWQALLSLLERTGELEESGSHTASNLGTGAGVFAGKVGADLRFRSLKAGAGIALEPSATEIEIKAGVVGEIPFYTSAGVYDPIQLTTNQEIPFINANGTVDDIALVSP